MQNVTNSTGHIFTDSGTPYQEFPGWAIGLLISLGVVLCGALERWIKRRYYNEGLEHMPLISPDHIQDPENNPQFQALKEVISAYPGQTEPTIEMGKLSSPTHTPGYTAQSETPSQGLEGVLTVSAEYRARPSAP